MPDLKQLTASSLRAGIYGALDAPAVTTITRSGQFSGVLISLGPMDPKLARRLGQVVQANPKHGVQLLLDNLKTGQ